MLFRSEAAELGNGDDEHDETLMTKGTMEVSTDHVEAVDTDTSPLLDATRTAAAPALLRDALTCDDATIADMEDALGVQGLTGLVDDTDDVGPGGPVQRLFAKPDVPLLPRPLPPAPRADAVTSVVRRSPRIQVKPKMKTMDKAIRVLNLKMGIDTGEEMPLILAHRQFCASYKNMMPDNVAQGLNVLFKLNMPCFDAATDALVAMAGPGGTEFAPSAEQEVIV